MQKQQDVVDTKLVDLENGLPQVHSVPTKGETSVVKDVDNEKTKGKKDQRSYMRRVVCSKSSLLLVLLFLVAFTSYLVWQAPKHASSSEDDEPTEEELQEQMNELNYRMTLDQQYVDARKRFFKARDIFDKYMDDLVNESSKGIPLQAHRILHLKNLISAKDDAQHEVFDSWLKINGVGEMPVPSEEQTPSPRRREWHRIYRRSAKFDDVFDNEDFSDIEAHL